MFPKYEYSFHIPEGQIRTLDELIDRFRSVCSAVFEHYQNIQVSALSLEQFRGSLYSAMLSFCAANNIMDLKAVLEHEIDQVIDKVRREVGL